MLENTPGAGSEMRKQAAELVRQQQLKESAALEGGKDKEGLQEQNGFTEFCENFKAPDPRGNPNYARMQELCAKSGKDHGAALYKEVVHNIPRAMFIFLPLLALAMKLMYWRPKRYYVEHLLFLVHNHAFVFLTLAILALLGRIPVVGDHLSWLNFFVWLYMFWYLFRAMRERLPAVTRPDPREVLRHRLFLHLRGHHGADPHRDLQRLHRRGVATRCRLRGAFPWV